MSDNPADLDLDNPFWRFSLRTYRRPGVAQTCLDMQGGFGVDVNLLLFWIWAGIEPGIAADAALLRRADDHVAAWRANIVLPLRGARGWAKGQPFMRDPACIGLRDAIKREELAAERIEQAMLHRLARALPATAHPTPELAAANAAAYLHILGVRNGAETAQRLAGSL